MTNKEYKKRLEEIEIYNGWDYLNREELKHLRKYIKSSNGDILPNTNNKATVRGENGHLILRSYYTDVAMFDGDKIVKLWDGYSATTLRHINEFARRCNVNGFSKREWIEL